VPSAPGTSGAPGEGKGEEEPLDTWETYAEEKQQILLREREELHQKDLEFITDLERQAEEWDAQEAADKEEAAALYTEQLTWAGTNLANILNTALFDTADGFGKGLMRAAGDFVKRLAAGILQNAIIMLLLNAFTGQEITFAGLFKGIVPGMQHGGMIPATPGGRLYLGGEGGEREFVIPESRLAAAFQRYGSLGPAYAAAQVSGETLVQSQVTVNESQPIVEVVVAPEGILRLVEKGQRARVIQQGQ